MSWQKKQLSIVIIIISQISVVYKEYYTRIHFIECYKCVIVLEEAIHN